MIDQAVDSGRYASEEDVINEAMALLAEKERRFQELRSLIEEAYEEDGVESEDDVIAAVDRALVETQPKAAE